MKTNAAGSIVIAAALAAGLAPAEDDLDVVRRAVAESRESGDSPAPAPETSPARKTRSPQWLKVRIVDKTSRKARVSVNLPLGLVRALGNEWPLDGRCRSRHAEDRGERCSVRIGDVLRSLEAGQGIVEIDDAEASVRVWVE